MKLKRWYKRVLAIWFFTGLPALAILLAHMWSGGSIRPNFFHPLEPLPWEFAWVLMILPIILAPAGMRFGRRSP